MILITKQYTFFYLSGSQNGVGFIRKIVQAQFELMKEAIGEVLDELSKCLELKMGLNVFYEQTGGLFPDFRLNIWSPDISEKLPSLIEKLKELGLRYKYVERGFFTYLQIYTPKNSLKTTPSRAFRGWVLND